MRTNTKYAVAVLFAFLAAAAVQGGEFNEALLLKKAQVVIHSPQAGDVVTEGIPIQLDVSSIKYRFVYVQLSRDGGKTYTMLGTIATIKATGKNSLRKPREGNLEWVPFGPGPNCYLKFTLAGNPNVPVLFGPFTILAAPLGPTGPQGIQGPVGLTGPQGAVGPAGAQGPVGPVGPAGEVGPAGPQGQVGPIGPQGADGSMGLPGEAGPMGPPGQDGAQGPQGPAGNDGAVGPQGPAGNDGAQGADGPQGPAGNDGATGPQGPVGPQGTPGPQGIPGLPAGTAGFVTVNNVFDGYFTVTVTNAVVKTTSIILVTYYDLSTGTECQRIAAWVANVQNGKFDVRVRHDCVSQPSDKIFYLIINPAAN